MQTQKLFYDDSHEIDFAARILSCEAGANGFQVVLDQTLFYPGGGGQPCDLGTLAEVSVTDVHEKDGVIVHTCAEALAVGTTVVGQVDWIHRFDLMQQHSGEHIVSGIVHQFYGLDNVGFHMGTDMITIDFNGQLSDDQLSHVEWVANGAIWRNIEVTAHFPTELELAQKEFRSKKTLTGPVRLVEFPGVDLCACCGTHVNSTGEIGVIRLFSCVKLRGGCRIEMLSGSRCLEYLRTIWDQNHQISGLLSAKPLGTAAAVGRMATDLANAKFCLTQTENKLFALQAQGLQGTGNVLLQEADLTPDALRRLTIAICATCQGRAAVFSPIEGGYQYAMGQEGGDLSALSRALNAALNGRGGGKPNFVQGSVQADWAAIQAFFNQY